MRRSWSRMVSRLFRKPLAKPAVRRVPKLRIESLEDRVVPATVITILDNGVGSLDGFLSATDGTITAADNAGIPGTLSRAALQGVNPNISISITAETQIVFGDLSAPLLLQTAAGSSARFDAQITSITFTDGSDSLQTAGGDLELIGRTLVGAGALTSAGGDIMLVGDDLALQAAIDAGTGRVTLKPFSAARDIDLGTETAGSTSLTQAELSLVTAGVLHIGEINVGNITFTDSIVLSPVSVDALSLFSGDTITDTATGSVSVNALQAFGADGVTLDSTSSVNVLAGSVTTGGAGFAYHDGGLVAFEVGTVDGVSGISTNLVTPLSFIELSAGGAVTQSAGADLHTRNLLLLGTGSYSLSNPGNGTIFLAAAITGSLAYVDADALTVGSISGTAGITTGVTTTDSSISLSTVDGTLSVEDTKSGADVDAGTGTVFLNAASITTDNLLTLDTNAGVTGTGGITLRSNGMTIGAAVNGGTSTVRLETDTAATAIDLGGTDAAGVLGLTDTELDFVTAGTLIVGNTANTGNISITAAISPAGTSQLELETGDASIVNGGGSITETRLGLTANALIGAVANPLATSVSNLEAVTNTNGINIANTTTILTIGGVNATLNGIQVLDNGPIGITSNDFIIVLETIVNAGGNIDLTTISSNIHVNAAISSTGNVGSITITAEDNVNVNAAISASGTGDITIIAEPTLGNSGTITTNAGGTITAEEGDIRLAAMDNVNINEAVTVTAGTGSIAVVAEATTGISGAAGNFTSAGLGTLTTFGGDISIQAGDDISVDAAVSAGGAGNVIINADAAIDDVGGFTNTAAGTIATAGGNVTITAEDVTIGGTIGTTTAVGTRVEFFAQRTTEVFLLGGNADYGLTDAELDLVTTETIQVGDAANTGGIQLDGPVSGATYSTLHLITGGAIVDNNGSGVDITVLNLALSAANGIGSLDPLDVSVTNLAATNSTAGNIEVANTGALNLPVGGVDGVVGVSNAGADIFLSATNGAITVDAPIAATGGGSIGLTTFGANGAILNTANGSIRTTGGNGDIHLNASNADGGSITIENGPILQDVFAAGVGKITLDASTSVLVAAGVTIQSGVVSAGTGGTITIRSNVGQVNGTEDISLLGGVQFTRVETNGDIVIDADPDGNCVGGTLITTATTSLKSPDGTTGAANIDINVATDIVLRFALAVGNITVHSCQNILDDGDDSTAYGAGNNILLEAFGIMGGATPITTADVLSASTATPTANYRAALDLAWGGTLTVDQTGSLGNIQVRKIGSPLVISTVDGVNGAADIVGSGNQFVLIGAAGVVVDEVFTLSGAVNADFFLASVNGSNIDFVGAGSAINNGANTTTTVIASGNTSASIVGPAANDTANVTGFNVVLATSGGNIGAPGSPIEINANAAGRFDGFTIGAVNGVASPGGDAFITDTQNGIRVGLFNAGAGEVELNSLGNITPTGSSIVAVTHNDNVAEIVADIVSLNATGTSTGTGGQIGLPGQFVEVNSNVLSASTNNSNLWISEVGTGASAGTDIGLVTLGTTAGTTTAFLRVRNGGTIESVSVDSTADVIAPVVNLSNVAGDTPTGGGFGTSTASPLEIDAATLNANLPNGGTLFVNDVAGGLTVQRANTTSGAVGIQSSGVGVDLILGNASSTGSVVSATGAVTLQSGFGILSAAPAGVLDVTGASLAVTADSNFGLVGTPIQTAVSKVGGTVAGGFLLENTTGLDLDTVLANTDITITTVDAGTAGQNIAVLAGDVVSSFAGNVNLQAGDNISIPTGATVEAPMGTVALSGDFNDADTGAGATIDIAGAVTSGNVATVTGGPDSDSIFIAVGANDTAFDVNGNAPVFPTFPGDTLELDLTGVTNPVLTPTGTGAGTYDFGNKPSVTFTSIEDLEPGQTISGTIFLDANRNGVRDANELPVAGNTVHLDRGNDGTDDEFTFTDADGFYSFPDQTPGTYSIRFDSDPNFVLTSPNPVVIGPLDTTTGLDFGTFGRSLEVIAGPTSGTVILRDAENGTVFQTIIPYPGFIGTVTTAVADVNGDGYLDAITGAGPGGGPHVKVFSGRDFTKIVDFFAYDNSFRGGVYVATGDLNGDGLPEIITGAGQDGGPHVKVFIGGSFLGAAAVEVASFFAYASSVRSGVHVGAADVNGDGVADIITGAREGFAPHVKVFDPVAQTEIRSFFAYDASFTGGVFVAGGDLDGDGFAEIITGSSTFTSHVKAFSGQNGSLVRSFFAFNSNVPGVAVGVSDKDNDGMFDILAGSRIGSHVQVFDGVTLAALDSFLAFGTDLNGVFVGGA